MGVVILNWNGWKDTRECLASLQRLDSPPSLVIVVDNGSRGNDVACIRASFPSCTTIEAGANLGFAGGCNLGIQNALERGATHILMINNDVEVDSPNLLEAMISVAAEDVAAVGCLVVYRDDPTRVWYANGTVDLSRAKTRHVGFGQPRSRFHGVVAADYITGCCMLISRAALDRVGLLDDSFFLFYEETDWCVRAKAVGFRLLVNQDVVVRHGVSRSMERAGNVVEYYITRSRLIFARRWSGRWWPVAAASIMSFAAMRSGWDLLKGKGRVALLPLRGVLDYVRGRRGELR